MRKYNLGRIGFSRKFINILCLNILWILSVYSQEVSPQLKKPLSYLEFMDLVVKNNLQYAAEKFNLDIADAELVSSKVFPDPEVSFSWFDNSNRKMQLGTGYAAAIDWTLELGGKRHARIEVAKGQQKLAHHFLEHHFQHLRADATILFLKAIHQKSTLEVQKRAYRNILELATLDSVRYQLGEISLANAKQSTLEANMMLNDLWQAESDFKNAIKQLEVMLGIQNMAEDVVTDGSSLALDRVYELDKLIEVALESRADFLATKESKKASSDLIRLAKANRAIDLGLNVSVERNTEARNIIAETPAFTSYHAGVSIPLKFSNRRSDELRVAKLNLQQSDLNVQHAELNIHTEVSLAFNDYQTLNRQINQYQDKLLQESADILKSKTYSYERGESSLLEVLDAQRTYNDIQENYYQTLYQYAVSLVELQLAVGIWDIKL